MTLLSLWQRAWKYRVWIVAGVAVVAILVASRMITLTRVRNFALRAKELVTHSRQVVTVEEGKQKDREAIQKALDKLQEQIDKSVAEHDRLLRELQGRVSK